VELLGNLTYPEGILERPNGDIFVGGFGDGSIQKIEGGETVSYFSAPGENGMRRAVGFMIDEARGRLWVSNFDFVEGSQLKVFDVQTGSVIATIPETFLPGVFFNEVAMDSAGRVYVSDTFNPVIWTASENLDGVEVFVNNTLLQNPVRPFGLNGLALTPDGEYLIASVMDRLDAGNGTLVRIDVSSRSVDLVTLSSGSSEVVASFAGSDGMFFGEGGLLYMVNVFSPAGAIFTAEFSADYSSASLTVRDAFQAVYDRPTASAMLDGRLWTVNSQLDHIIDDQNGAVNTPPSLPFTVVHVPTSDLIETSATSTTTASTASASGAIFVELLGNLTYPEGILERPNGDIFVGGFGDGSIQKIEGGETVSYFSAPGENGMRRAVGFMIDEARGRLWVSNFDFVEGSQLKVFDVQTGSVIATIPETFLPGVFFNEVAMDSAGRVYVSDTFNPVIWTASENLDGVEVFVNNTLLQNPVRPFGLNGLALTPDGEYLIASVMDRLDAGNGTLVRIDVSSRSVDLVTLSSGSSEVVASFAGSDGMFFGEGGLLYMVNVFSPAGAIFTAEFSADYSSASLTVRDAFQAVYDRPTASAMLDGRLWTVNSQLDHIIDDQNGAVNTPPSLPFTVVHVPTSDLIETSTTSTTVTMEVSSALTSHSLLSLCSLAACMVLVTTLF